MSVGKIILKSTTRISLNDRFTVLRNENPPASNNGYYDAASESRQHVQASRKNQRLAAQMERRPAVMAALKPKKNLGNRLNTNQTVSVKQRLALPGRIRLPDTFRGSLRGSRRGIANIRIRGGINTSRGKFQGRISTESRGGSSFRGRARGGRFGNAGRGGGGIGGGGQRGRGGQGGQGGRGVGRGRGFSRGRGRIFR